MDGKAEEVEGKEKKKFNWRKGLGILGIVAVSGVAGWGGGYLFNGVYHNLNTKIKKDSAQIIENIFAENEPERIVHDDDRTPWGITDIYRIDDGTMLQHSYGINFDSDWLPKGRELCVLVLDNTLEYEDLNCRGYTNPIYIDVTLDGRHWGYSLKGIRSRYLDNRGIQRIYNIALTNFEAELEELRNTEQLIDPEVKKDSAQTLDEIFRDNVPEHIIQNHENPWGFMDKYVVDEDTILYHFYGDNPYSEQEPEANELCVLVMSAGEMYKDINCVGNPTISGFELNSLARILGNPKDEYFQLKYNLALKEIDIELDELREANILALEIDSEQKLAAELDELGEASNLALKTDSTKILENIFAENEPVRTIQPDDSPWRYWDTYTIDNNTKLFHIHGNNPNYEGDFEVDDSCILMINGDMVYTDTKCNGNADWGKSYQETYNSALKEFDAELDKLRDAQ